MGRGVCSQIGILKLNIVKPYNFSLNVENVEKKTFLFLMTVQFFGILLA